ncbi:MAG: glycosyltransferase family 4 protein, partial [Ktedonobacterales bacterium]
MSRLRVAVIAFDPYPYEGRARRLAEAAVDCGAEVDAIGLSLGDGSRLPTEQHGVRIYPLPLTRRLGAPMAWTVLEWLWFTALAAVKVAQLHQTRRYDIIHVHNMPDFLVFSALWPRLRGARVILDVQDVSPELMAAKAGRRSRGPLTLFARAQERVSTAFADFVVTVGWPFEQRLLARGVPQRKLTSFINSADPSIFPASLQGPIPYDANDEQGPFHFMFYGTISRRLGIDTALQALALARREVPRLTLDIMGEGDDVELFQQMAADLGLQGAVTFRPAVAPGPELAEFVVSHDAGIVSYHADGFADLLLPTKAYEMAWLRRPMVVSNTPAICSMFRPESVLLCDSESPEAFAQAMVQLSRSATLRQAMVTNAAQDYERFRWERERERYYALLQDLARQSPQPRAVSLDVN